MQFIEFLELLYTACQMLLSLWLTLIISLSHHWWVFSRFYCLCCLYFCWWA